MIFFPCPSYYPAFRVLELFEIFSMVHDCGNVTICKTAKVASNLNVGRGINFQTVLDGKSLISQISYLVDHHNCPLRIFPAESWSLCFLHAPCAFQWAYLVSYQLWAWNPFGLCPLIKDSRLAPTYPKSPIPGASITKRPTHTRSLALSKVSSSNAVWSKRPAKHPNYRSSGSCKKS